MLGRTLATFGLALFLAACASAASTEPSGDSPGPLGAGDCGTQPVTRIDAILIASSGSPAPEPDRHAAPELEALLPKMIAGAAFSVNSFRWEAGSPDGLTPLIGKRPENMCYAYAMSIDPAKLPVGIAVHRIVGVPAVQLRTAMLQSWFALDAPPNEQTVGGKQVILVQMTGSPMLCCSNGPVYLYSWGEALFAVLPADAEVAATALQALP
jgi:hypothetical protein